jgi:dUTP pyrophosphatase
MSVRIKIERLEKDLPLPSYAYAGDAAFDLFAAVETKLQPQEFVAIPTGLKMEIPDGYVGLIWDKSGIAIKKGLKTLGGVVDSGYRGELRIGIINLSKEVYLFSKGDRIAQMIIQKKEEVDIEEVESVSDSHRGDRGFGSSGK